VRDVTATQTQSEVPDLADLARVSAELEQEPASSAIKWAWETFGEGAVLAASFQDCVLIDIATQVVPEMEVVFLDTQYHFAETLWYVEQVRERYDLNLRVISPQIAICPKLEVNRTSLWRARNDAFDPKLTCHKSQ